jgi:DNA-binding beta-propeller fold protein YncE
MPLTGVAVSPDGSTIYVIHESGNAAVGTVSVITLV